jgi:translin
MSDSKWDVIVGSLKDKAQEMHSGREKGLALCRALTQTSARCIRHIHRHQFEAADGLLEEAKSLASQARQSLSQYPEIFHAGFLHDAEKEMVEAAAVLAIVRNEPYPSPELLSTMPMSYLNGMGEAASECRRFALDEMRHGRIEEADRILGHMEAIYDELITFDYSDAMTGGLRRTCDALRAVIERTRSDLTATSAQHQLVQELRATRERLK